MSCFLESFDFAGFCVPGCLGKRFGGLRRILGELACLGGWGWTDAVLVEVLGFWKLEGTLLTCSVFGPQG